MKKTILLVFLLAGCDTADRSMPQLKTWNRSYAEKVNVERLTDKEIELCLIAKQNKDKFIPSLCRKVERNALIAEARKRQIEVAREAFGE